MNDCPEGRMSEDKMKEMFATTVAKSKVTFSINIQDKSILKIFIKEFANVVLFLRAAPATNLWNNCSVFLTKTVMVG